MPIHCLRCKLKTDDKDVNETTTSTGRRMSVAHCTECGKKKCKFLPNLSTKV